MIIPKKFFQFLVECDEEKRILKIPPPKTIPQLTDSVRNLFGWDQKQQFFVEYWSEDFKDFVRLDDVSMIKDKLKLRMKRAPKGKGEKVFFRISFQGWAPIRPEGEKVADMTENEAKREAAKDIVVKTLNTLMELGWSMFKLVFCFQEIDLSHTIASMRAIFGGTDGTGAKTTREEELVKLNLSFTVTSSRSITTLHFMKCLRFLYLDHCNSLKSTNVFSALLLQKPVQNLEVLSVVGTSDVFSSDWLVQVESRCPKLKTVYFTRKPGSKALGWTDIVLLQTMRSPVLLPCGHISDKDSFAPSAPSELTKCPLCRSEFELTALITMNPHITRVDKMEGKWNAQIVDSSRNPLDSKVLYHILCCEFYNWSTLQQLYGCEDSLERAKKDLRGQVCNGCFKKFKSSREIAICFPSAVDDRDARKFETLNEASWYSNV